MTELAARPGQLNLDETPAWGSRSIDNFVKLEHIGEGTYGYIQLTSSVDKFYISVFSLCHHLFPVEYFAGSFITGFFLSLKSAKL